MSLPTRPPKLYDYDTDGSSIYSKSFGMIRAEADLDRFAEPERTVAVRMIHAAGITRRRLPADNEVICTLHDPRVPDLAAAWQTTRSAAAVSLWDQLEGAVVAIDNAPTALFQLLEIVTAGRPRPAAVIGIPVGFVGSPESKTALAGNPYGLEWLVVHGRRGGSALASSAINALAREEEI